MHLPVHLPRISQVDDGSLSLDDVRCESGFRQQVESSASFDLQADTPYLLIPMTYRRGVELPFEIEIYCDQPSLRVEQLAREADLLDLLLPELLLEAHRLARRRVQLRARSAITSPISFCRSLELPALSCCIESTSA